MKYLRISFIIVVIISSFIGRSYAQNNHRNAFADFVSAGMDYTNGKYSEAIQKYENIIKKGEESGAVYFNLGNCYYKMGQKGKAILNYERALLLIPRDRDVRFNYKFISSELSQYAGNVQEKSFGTALNQFLTRYTFGEIVFLMTVVFVLFMGVHLVSLYFSAVKKHKVVLLGLLAGIFFILCCFSFLKSSYQHGLAIVLKDSAAYFEPRNESTKYFDLPEGVKVRVVKDEYDWLKIKRLDGKLGWVQAENIEKIKVSF